jgi:hypothetical protein
MHRISVGHKQYSSALPPGIRYSNDQTHYGIGRSIFFQGTQSAPLNLGTNAAYATYPVTVEAWAYNTVAGGPIIELQNPSTGQFSTLGDNFMGQASTPVATSSSQSWTAWPAGAWHHVAFTLWSSTASTTIADNITWWVDGAANGSTFGGGMALSSSPVDYRATGTTQLWAGMYQYTTSLANSPFTGYISEIRVSNNARYGTARTAFSPPNGAMTSDANTLLLYKAP